MDSIAPERMGCPYRHPFSHGLATPPLRSGAFARGAGARYLLDAAQAVGQFPVDVNEVGCDLLTGTGQKFFRGPRGTGFLWVRDTALERLDPFVAETRSATRDGGRGFTWAGGARRFETWENSYVNIIGLGAIGDRTRTLGERLREDLGQLPDVTTHDLGTHRSAIVTAKIAGRSADGVAVALGRATINVSTTVAEHNRLTPKSAASTHSSVSPRTTTTPKRRSTEPSPP
jgi:selenocysteine lyase/cysteine desulfurase